MQSLDDLAPSFAKRLVRIGVTACAALFCLFVFSSFARAAIQYQVVTSVLMLRDKPSVESNVLATLEKDTKMVLLELKGKWAKVQVGELTGYVDGEYIAMAETETPARNNSKAAAPTPSAPPERKRTSVTLKVGDTGADVLDLQDALLKKGYFSQDLSPEFGEYTKMAVVNFQSKNQMDPTGVADENTLKALYGKRTDRPEDVRYDYSEFMESDDPKTDNDVAEPEATDFEETRVNGSVKLVDWWSGEINKVLPRGSQAMVIDAETGVAFSIYRRGGSRHADCEPVSADDTAKMKALWGEWSWSARAIYLVVDGQYYAAAMNGMPHGGEVIGAENNFNGHFCMHFLNSRTHANNRENPDMQNKLMKAFNMAGGAGN